MDLDARCYRCFIGVAERRSFTRAAAKLNLSQPALSSQIHELERRLGFDLFKRNSRSVELTGEGSLFLPYAQRLVSETDLIKRAARDIKSNALRLGAAFHTELIPERAELIDKFLLAHPRMPINIQNDNHGRLLSNLDRQLIDVVITIEPILDAPATAVQNKSSRGERGERPVERIVLSTRAVDLALPKDHPLCRFAEIPPSALQGAPIVIPGRFHGVGLAEEITYRLTDLGAELIRAPEGHALAVEHYGRMSGMPAVSLNWFAPHLSVSAEETVEHRPISGLDFRTGLTLIRALRDQRPAAEQFWHDSQHYTAARPVYRSARAISLSYDQ